MIIKNCDEVVEKLTGMLMQFEKELNPYQTDVYLYYDPETETATLNTFINVGGNSWINDDHYTIYRDREHFNTYLDCWESISEIAEALDMTEKSLIKQTAEYFGYEEDEVDYWDIRKFINCHPEYFDKLVEQYEDMIEDHISDYIEQADGILERFLKEEII